MEKDKAVIWETESVCPVCLARLRAVIEEDLQGIFMRKACARHGEYRTLLWRGDPPYQTWSRPKSAFHPPDAWGEVKNGCPFDCGLCADHRQQTCAALIEVTSQCNLSCSVCFADSGAGNRPDPTLSEIRGWYETLIAKGYKCNIQLSGGEPTIRDDLPEIVALGRSIGFEFIQLNTNGLRLASDTKYLEQLKVAGLSSIFLQFDGTENEIYRALRGGDFFDAKVRAIRNCEQMELGVVLTPTLVPEVNLHNVGGIISFAVENLPTVRGVHFQPATYLGRYPGIPADKDRLTLPEVMRAVELQTQGLISIDSFAPPGCENSRCSFHGSFVAMPDGRLTALTKRSDQQCACGVQKAEVGAARARQCVSEQWSAWDAFPYAPAHGELSLGEWDTLLERAGAHRLSISAMAFQDVWTLDLERLRDCCIHVIARDGRLVPFCAYYLTGIDGRFLYRGN
jgi:7,8-dihydro-6-hydroxymethylpterin dimethyltransferase